MITATNATLGRRFSKELRDWTLTSDDRFQLTHIETHGHDLSDWMSNAALSFEDWHGNEALEGWELADLHPKDCDAIIEMFAEALATGAIA